MRRAYRSWVNVVRGSRLSDSPELRTSNIERLSVTRLMPTASKPRARASALIDSARDMVGSLWKTVWKRQNFTGSACLEQRQSTTQDAQKGRPLRPSFVSRLSSFASGDLHALRDTLHEERFTGYGLCAGGLFQHPASAIVGNSRSGQQTGPNNGRICSGCRSR